MGTGKNRGGRRAVLLTAAPFGAEIYSKLNAPDMSLAIILRLLFSMKKLGPACK
jgi:hypothetical protein